MDQDSRVLLLHRLVEHVLAKQGVPEPHLQSSVEPLFRYRMEGHP